MSSEEPTGDSRLERIEKRLNRLESTVSDLQEATKAVLDSGDPAGKEVSSRNVPETDQSPESSQGLESSQDPESPSESPQDPEMLTEPGKGPSGPSARGISSAGSPSTSDERGRASVDDSFRRYKAVFGLRGVDWISYAGIGLLLFGIVFLFKYSIDQGWITPEVRVGIGAAVGASLLLGGARRANRRPLLQQILFGGSVATFYGTVFAAYQLYGLLAYPVAFGAMLLVTTVSVALGLRQDYVSMAFIGTAGGLGTPFLLYAQTSGGPGLALYTCLVLGGACAVYLYKRWGRLPEA